mgnify:FL=1
MCNHFAALEESRESGQRVETQLMCPRLVVLKSCCFFLFWQARWVTMQGRDSCASLTQQLALGGAALGLRDNQ